MRKFNPFRSKSHRVPTTRETKTTSSLKNVSRPYSTVNINPTIPIQPITISAPIINSNDKVVIVDKEQSDETSDEEQTTIIEDDDAKEQLVVSEEPENMSDEFNHTDDQVD
jgi:hypothetical protein